MPADLTPTPFALATPPARAAELTPVERQLLRNQLAIMHELNLTATGSQSEDLRAASNATFRILHADAERRKNAKEFATRRCED